MQRPEPGQETERDRRNRQLDELIDERTRELTALLTHLQAFAEQEKSALARKLHDELGGLLTAAKMDLSWLQSRLEGTVIEGVAIQERLTQLGAVLDEAMNLKRRVVEELRPSLLDHFGLPTAARAYVEAVCNKAQLRAVVDVTHACEALSKDTAIALFRIVQAGLANILEHANATTVWLTLGGNAQRCTLTLRDDGTGFDTRDPELKESHGLMGARHRVRALGGTMDVSSRVPGGTTLKIEIPVQRSASDA
jgi:signal transduction histidine kinase